MGTNIIGGTSGAGVTKPALGPASTPSVSIAGSTPGASPAAAKADGRRAKACEHCRSLKVRCIPTDPLFPDKPCVRCVKGKHECVFHIGPRKRNKKNDK
ncbi:hypothetical protein D0Z00_003564 [Geotrichum galactomycetum]|uniref:Uncharacterized protein n=1 Tax=Geotrichum galactomycetum TaxID=27317 RepID=A0ACB6V0V8_9ASCO|nr:hypothetical protein D0Z00_003564 [Geotrichum candidum]